MTTPPLALIRNIGIISHIDAGKTTVSERILYYTGEIHKMGEVHDGEAVMDWMPQEQERGITITATASSCYWRDCRINLIDTPGHIDFTIEVERSMRVLDGGIAILSAVEGVQPQTESVWRQADRYRVPRICFINKMDRIGADFRAVLVAMESRLKARVVPVQLPVGKEADFLGVIDLLKEELVLFSDADQGMTVERLPIPQESLEEATAARNLLVEAAADFDDAVLADYLAGVKLPAERLLPALRTATLSCSICPVFCGAALRNKGIQPLLDGVVDFLPSPSDVPPVRGRTAGGDAVTISCDPASPLVAFAFKVLAEEGRRLTFLRIYSGALRNGSAIFNSSRDAFERADRLFHMHAHKREQITEAAPGDIVAVTGMKKTLTGDTLCEFNHRLILDGLAVPEPVVSVAVEAKGAEDRERLPGALEKLQWEDPTFRVHEDGETGQTILTGMGELHLEIITDRLNREYGITVKTGPPRVMYRETIRQPVTWRETFSQEINGRLQKGEVLLSLRPLPRGEGLRIIISPPEGLPLPPEMCVALEESLRHVCASGVRTGYPFADLEVQVMEVPFEPGVTTELGIKAAAHRGFTLAAQQASPVVLEPVMALEIITPAEHAGRVLGQIQQKRGRVEGLGGASENEVIHARVPLSEMFGYMTELRSATKGVGSFTMHFDHFQVANDEIQKGFGLV
ncbi:translation elongation factor G [Geotalea daltonii FRC-32]|uniref:Elongation factor G n=1 Tax=Geotalea daltonii (strain DSM 22248 / JCM 15807 / FRC-32) TaxID=316067 RepID=B9M6X8_GEODF|nr:elongation factor G [Geotalea daltonii]ACM21999.1 translation elongation factor G [Geotalea daltonii FRC-32]